MQRYIIAAVLLVLGGCAYGGYTSAEFVYGEPVAYEYVVPVDEVVVVTREVLVDDGWTVFRVEQSGPDRVVWARRGDDEVVRVLATPHDNRVAVRGLWEVRQSEGGNADREGHGHGRHWVRRGPPKEVLERIDSRLRRG